MNISQKGIDLIKEFEGCRTVAYLDAVGVWTIGYGTTNADKSITGVEVKKGLVITKTVAENWLKLTINKKYGAKVSKYDSKYHWNQNQYDALVSFAYNIGSIDQLTQNGTRTIKEISEKILAYDKAGGKVLAGLTRRRKAEKELFDTPVKGYSGKFPTLPQRGYFEKGDKGVNVQRLKLFLNWYGDYGLNAENDKIGDGTVKAINEFKKAYNLNINGQWGKNCQKFAKELKK